jgi:hypothetical protein
MALATMNPLSYDLGDALLARHRLICSKFTVTAATVSERQIEEAIISYKALLGSIGAPESLAEGIGNYLLELAEWCKAKNLPPINALAVNGKFQRPGTGYYTAPGCGNWDQEVRDCIACRRYPVSLSG